ncbi:type II secretion system protein N [Succinimonas sp.]|jgi:hypothetical protein|uniref:type II secretion system protein N n=1 Tax=Succinimonas sp. TaxID=1936151 RepID=UPI002E8887D7|nr:type II secretion system protein N [Succinimonas sp.]MEE3421279.1 type II secretion system protein N [Succinimonas sp.]
MIKRIIFRTLFIIFFFIFFVLYLAPANKLFAFVSLPKEIKIYDVRGSLWNGKISTMDASSVRINNIHWKLNFFTVLFTKGLSLKVNDSKLLRGSMGVNAFSLADKPHFSSIQLNGDLENIVPLIDKNLPFSLTGSIGTDISDLVLTGKGNLANVSGAVTARNVVLTTPFLPDVSVDLGKIELAVNGNQNKLSFKIDQNSEMLRFTGKLELTENLTAYNLTGNIKPKGDLPSQLAMFMGTLGTPNAEGSIPVSLQGKF